MPLYPLSTNISIWESSSIVHCHGKRMWTVWFQKSRKRLALWDVLEIHSHKQQDGSTICLSSSQTCSTVRMRTGLHSQNARQNRLIRSSKRALRAVINAPTTTPTKTILSLLNLSPLETRLKLKLLVHTFRCIHNKASSLLCAQYQVRSPTHSTQRTTRAQTYTSLIIPRVSKSAGAKSPAFFSTLLWNELPSDLRSLSSVHSFRQKLMVYLDSL